MVFLFNFLFVQYFISAHIPLFLYPFLNTSNNKKPFENLRVTSLGVIGALVKVNSISYIKGDDQDAINFLMQTEIIPLCLRIMKRGQELSRTVATFIVNYELYHIRFKKYY
jgi:CCR4-NOT transcription complex subunit 9